MPALCVLQDCELSGLSHSVGVHVHGFGRSQRRRQARAFNLSLNAGDLYVFNSNRLHEVPPVERGVRPAVGPPPAPLPLAADSGPGKVRVW